MKYLSPSTSAPKAQWNIRLIVLQYHFWPQLEFLNDYTGKVSLKAIFHTKYEAGRSSISSACFIFILVIETLAVSRPYVNTIIRTKNHCQSENNEKVSSFLCKIFKFITFIIYIIKNINILLSWLKTFIQTTDLFFHSNIRE